MAMFEIKNGEGIIPEGTTEISHESFAGCEDLERIEFPDSVMIVYPQAFEDCKSLKKIEFKGDIMTIGAGAFENCTSLTSVVFHKDVMKIESYAFEGCTSLSNLEFREGIMRIGNYAFQNCIGLSSIVIPYTVSDLRATAFAECTGIKAIQFKGWMKCDMYWLIDAMMSAGEGSDGLGNYAHILPGSLKKILVPKGAGEFYRNQMMKTYELEHYGDLDRKYARLIEEVTADKYLEQ